MNKECFLLLLSIHIIADFYLQTQKIADTKNQKNRNLIKHILIYLLCGIIFLALVPSVQTTLAILLVVASHGLIDWAKKLVLAKIKVKKATQTTIDAIMFFADQVAHVIIIFIISCLFVAWGGEIRLARIISNACTNLNLNVGLFARWGISILLVCKPTNIILKTIIVKYSPKSDGKDIDTEKVKAGAFIGSIERLLVLIFFALAQYASVGLILTAKSIVRYSEFAADKDFADYYIIGTLTSLLSGIIVYYLILA